jgi:hypothetical protein
MRMWARALIVAAAVLPLASCLWGPGKFQSGLALRKDGSFALDYRGEIVLQSAEGMKGDKLEPWSDEKAHCLVGEDGRKLSSAVAVVEGPGGTRPKERPCTKAEIASQKLAYDEQQADMRAAQSKKADEMAQMFGMPGADDASARAFAAKLSKYAGWRSVAYRGKGVFDVDYHFEGRLTQDYVFPLMPDNELIIPFVALRRRSDGSVMMSAPGLGGNPFAARAKAAGMPDSDGPPSRAEGRLTVTTDGEILTNNSEDGPSPHALGRQVHWDISPASVKTPEMLVRL